MRSHPIRLPLALALAFALAPALAEAGRTRPITMKVPAYDVEASSNREVCTFVPVPHGGSFDIGSWVVKNLDTDELSTSHHFIIYAYTGTDFEQMNQYAGKIVDDNACIGIVPNPADLRFLGGAQTPRYKQRMPKGLALRVDPTVLEDAKKPVIGFVLNSHWINGSPTRRRARASIKLIPAKRGSVKQVLKPIFDVVANGTLKVPPGETRSTGFSWGPGLPDLGAALGGVPNPTGPACVTMVTGHMHRRGSLFEAHYSTRSGRELVYSSTTYDDPGQRDFSPPLLVKPGETIAYNCTQDNATDPRRGCEETPGVTPGKSIIEALGSGLGFVGPSKFCTSDADCTGYGTGRCVPANLVFGFLSEDDMCIMPGYYYDADPETGCDIAKSRKKK